MSNRFERISALTGVVAVALWVVGIVVAVVMTHQPAADATDAQVLSWVKAHSSLLTGGAWIFMIGCGSFVWFAGAIRDRLAAAEGGTAPATAVGFGAAAATGVLAMGLAAGDMAAGIGASDVSPAAAGALHQLSTVFFLLVEMGAAVMLAGFSAAALRSHALPRWWAIVGIVLAVFLLVGPVGWLGVMFGLPLWTLATSLVLLRGAAPRTAAAPAASPA